jgi:hypothetical protein
MYKNARLSIYQSLTKVSGADPSIAFTVSAEDIIDWNIDDKIGAADDMFEIYGRKAEIVLPYANEIKAWLQSKSVNSTYPEYMDAVLELIDNDSGIIQFRGALQIDRITHNYDSGIVTIVLSDALDLWITQARKHFFNFTDDDNWWAIEDEYLPSRSLPELLTVPLANMALGLDSFTDDFDTYSLNVVDQALVIENYGNNFSTNDNPRLTNSSGTEYPYDWYNKYVNVSYANNEFKLIMIWLKKYTGINGSVPTYYAGAQIVRYNKDNLFQPIQNEWKQKVTVTLSDIINEFSSYITLLDNGSGEIIASGHSNSASHTEGALTWQIRFIDNIFYVSCALYMEMLRFKSGSVDYATIMLALLTANILHLYADNNGLRHVVNGALNPNYTLTGGLEIPDYDIIGQNRTGIFADIKKASSGVSALILSENFINAINSVYQAQIDSIACKLSFMLPESYYTSIELFDIISVDGYAYITTLIGYPKEGLIEIECVGEWN